jgi:biopolymer transport protein ExbD/biopolymer transport protein TolR
MSDINMTPLIDVMLVLLVIFMITAPLMTSSLKLDLPRAEGATPSDAPRVVAIAVDVHGRLYWGDEAVDDDRMRSHVRDAARQDPATQVQLRADRNVPYGRIAELIGMLHEGGLNRVGFVTETAAAPSN